MTAYEKKPSRIQALQFGVNGGNAQAIAQALVPLGVTTWWIPEHGQFSLNEVNEIEETTIPEVLRLSDTEGREWIVNPTDWVTVNSLQELTVFTNAAFLENYKPV